MSEYYHLPEDLKVWLQSSAEHKAIFQDGQVLELTASALEEDLRWDEERLRDFTAAGGVVTTAPAMTVVALQDQAAVTEFTEDGETYYLVNIPAGNEQEIALLEGAWIALVDSYATRGACEDVLSELYANMGNYDHTAGLERLTAKFLTDHRLTAEILGLAVPHEETLDEMLEVSA